jgi:hypothetical protein
LPDHRGATEHSYRIAPHAQPPQKDVTIETLLLMGERFSDNVSEATELFDYLLLKQEHSFREALPNAGPQPRLEAGARYERTL